MQWALAISPVTALLSHWTKEYKPPLHNNILKLFSYTFTFRHLSFFLSVAFSLEGHHLDPKIHSTPSRNLEGNQLISSIPRALLGGTWHLWWGFFLFSIGPAQGYFLSCCLQAVCLLFIFFPHWIPATAWWSSPLHCSRYTTASHSPSYQKSGVFSLVLQRLYKFSRSWSHFLCMEISLNRAGNNLVTERQMLSQQKQAEMNSSQGESQQVLRPVLVSSHSACSLIFPELQPAPKFWPTFHFVWSLHGL